MKNVRYVVLAVLLMAAAAHAADRQDADQGYMDAAVAYAEADQARTVAANRRLMLSKMQVSVFTKFLAMERDYDGANTQGLTKAQYDEMSALQREVTTAIDNSGSWLDTADTRLYTAGSYFVQSGDFETAYALGDWNECVTVCNRSMNYATFAYCDVISAEGWIAVGETSNAALLSLLVGYGY